MAHQWFVSQATRQLGPLTAQQLKALAARGEVAPTDLVRRDCDAVWVKASEIKGLFPAQAAPHSIATGSSAPSIPQPNPYATLPQAIPMASVPTAPAAPMAGSQFPVPQPVEPPVVLRARKRSSLPLWLLVGSVGAMLLIGVGSVSLVLMVMSLKSPQEPKVAQPPSPPRPAAVPDAALAEVASLREELQRLREAQQQQSAMEPAPELEKPKAEVSPVRNSNSVSTSTEQPSSQGSSAKPIPKLADLIAEVEPSVVRIEVNAVDGESVGSGFIVGGGRTVCTNYHVIEGAKSAEVIFSDSSRAPVLGYRLIAPEFDLAFIEIGLPKGRNPLKLAYGKPRKGEKVLALGAPKGLSFSVSEGIVSALRTADEVAESVGEEIFEVMGFDRKSEWIQITTPISGGNSGGPLLNEYGEVVGVNSWQRTDGQNLNFAVAVKHVINLEGRALTSPIRSLKLLPKPRLIASGPTGSSPLPEGTDMEEWLSRIRAIEEKRAELIRRRDAVESKLRQQQLAFKQGAAEFASLQQQIAFLQRSIADKLARASALRSAASQDSSLLVSNLSQARSLESTASVEQQQLTQLQTTAARLQTAGRQLESEIQASETQLKQLYDEADALRITWLKVVDPFGAIRRGRSDVAVQMFTRWLEIEPNPLAYFGRGLAYWNMDRMEDALSDLNRAVDMAEDSMFLAVRGAIRFQMGEQRAGMSDLTRAKSLDKSNTIALYFHAVTKCVRGLYSAGEKDFLACLKLDPEDVNSCHYLALLKATCPEEKLRDGKSAVELATKACELTEWKSWSCIDTLAAAYAEAGDYEKAVEHAQRALKLAPPPMREMCEDHIMLFGERKPWRLDWTEWNEWNRY